MWIAVVFLIVLGAVVIGFVRGGEIFCLAIHDGEVEVVRGRVPAALLDDFRDVMADGPTKARARVRGVVDDVAGASLKISGVIDPGRAQRLRNVFALYPLSRLR